jgi:hypothetical protein
MLKAETVEAYATSNLVFIFFKLLESFAAERRLQVYCFFRLHMSAVVILV